MDQGHLVLVIYAILVYSREGQTKETYYCRDGCMCVLSLFLKKEDIKLVNGLAGQETQLDPA